MTGYVALYNLRTADLRQILWITQSSPYQKGSVGSQLSTSGSTAIELNYPAIQLTGFEWNKLSWTATNSLGHIIDCHAKKLRWNVLAIRCYLLFLLLWIKGACPVWPFLVQVGAV